MGHRGTEDTESLFAEMQARVGQEGLASSDGDVEKIARALLG